MPAGQRLDVDPGDGASVELRCDLLPNGPAAGYPDLLRAHDGDMLGVPDAGVKGKAIEPGSLRAGTTAAAEPRTGPVTVRTSSTQKNRWPDARTGPSVFLRYLTCHRSGCPT